MIGLGNIGRHIAANLVTDGHEVTVYDVDAARAAAIEGAEAAASVAAVGKASEITLLSLPTPKIVREVAEEWATGAAPGSILVDLSTNSPDVVRELGARLAASGHVLVEAPLTGGTPGAENRMLMFMMGGDDDAVARVRPVVDPLGRATFHLGALGLGNTMKLVNSLLAFTTTWVSLEGLSLAAKSGITVQQAVEVLRTGGAGNFYLERMVEGIDQRGRPQTFALELAAKDAGLIVDTGRALGVPTPAGAAVLGVLVGAVAAGLGDHDWSDLVAAAERQGDVTLRWDQS
jgi:3-hydroxyisobutyrate dehydrogenase-like beta-hydroxyacid dehydrogenase